MSKRKNVRKRTKEWIEYTTDKTKAAKVGKKPIKRLLRIVVLYFMFIRLLCSLVLFVCTTAPAHSLYAIDSASGIQSSYIELHILNILQNGLNTHRQREEEEMVKESLRVRAESS